jgi:glycosyltransferase involved in cell wall biosynthesis
VRKAGQPNQLMILIPAFNEEGAIADVIREVNQVMPRVPVLVVDDARRATTRWAALNRPAATCCGCRITWG